MNLPAHLRDLLFKALAGLTAPLKGYRTAIGIVGAVALVVYGVMTANFELAGVALTLLFGLIGLRPENPPSADNPSVPAPTGAPAGAGRSLPGRRPGLLQRTWLLLLRRPGSRQVSLLHEVRLWRQGRCGQVLLRIGRRSMVGVKVKTKDQTKKVLAKAKRAAVKNLGHAGAAIRLTAKRSIRRSKKASPAGKPPHTRKGQLRGAIAYAVEGGETVVVGPEHDKVGKSGSAHEKGGRYKRQRYPKRPFMAPALEANQDRLPKLWANSVK